MEIVWFGGGCFRLRDRNTVAITDPYLPDPRFQNLRIKADVTTSSLADQKPRKLVPATRESIYSIQGPGEYEIGGIFVRALPAHRPHPESNGQVDTFVYRFTVQGVTICHMGQLAGPPRQDVIDEFESPHVLILPPGGRGEFSQGDAIRLVSAMTPSIVVPMGYAAAAAEENQAAIEEFLREIGMDIPEALPALSLRRSALPTENMEVAQLESRTKLKRPVGEQT